LVHFDAVLTAGASEKGGGGNWQTSIVDLLKGLDLDSSLAARKEGGGALGVHPAGAGPRNRTCCVMPRCEARRNSGKIPAGMMG
jgi:hypothetical protein